MRKARRFVARPRPAVITKLDVLARTISAIRALKAIPDAERRFLTAGSRSSWVPTVVEFADIVAQLEESLKDDVAPRARYRPTRREISDAMVAGEWFAKLALTIENIIEFEHSIDAYRARRRRSPNVEDQRILSRWSQGWSLALIGEASTPKMNAEQVERRLDEIAESLWRIANGYARLVEPRNGRRAGQHREVGAAVGGAGA